ncbi:hypothetical protein DC3_51710 [Deinococcus cellulosilyticus NBRC 106333 = KACC 11606]|uniref:Uncharacterized protein n=1 Tax=Deinococcus cellulosilyticus (strain DSM 18568 / NBRC 106333 / KACC 11606 / 5516J-15) TaxID=1223518 RepID=A0A511NAG8_DEIC1|nr:hypothetical protein DC3_51710 [Deinococcus cellulosilyticus NBRC 106333 = KACC 11606]
MGASLGRKYGRRVVLVVLEQPAAGCFHFLGRTSFQREPIPVLEEKRPSHRLIYEHSFIYHGVMTAQSKNTLSYDVDCASGVNKIENATSRLSGTHIK